MVGKQTTKILTRNGQDIDFLDPGKTRIDWEDIAFALPRIFRYGGHQDTTLLDHLAFCTMYARYECPAVTRYAAAHDVHEVYTGDWSPALKELIPDLREIEELWAAHTHLSLNLEWPHKHGTLVKWIDIRARECESIWHGFNTIWFQESGMEPMTDVEKDISALVFSATESAKLDIVHRAIYENQD